MELISYFSNPLDFINKTAYCERIGDHFSNHYYLSNIKGKQQRNRENNYLTHSLYVYKGKFIPQIIRALINYANIPLNGVILDTFCGSGTTCLESSLMNYSSIGFDVNPISCFMSEVKTNILFESLPEIINYSHFFENNFDVFEKIHKNVEIIQDFEMTKKVFVLCYLSALSDARYLGIDKRAAYKINSQRIISLLSQYNEIKGRLIAHHPKETRIICDDCLNLQNHIGKQKFDLILTSPPYVDAIDYVDNDLHALQYFVIDENKLRERIFGEKTLKDSTQQYWDKMKIWFQLMIEYLKDQSILVLIVGSIYTMFNKCIELAIKSGFLLEHHLIDKRIAKNRNYYDEHILIFRKT